MFRTLNMLKYWTCFRHTRSILSAPKSGLHRPRLRLSSTKAKPASPTQRGSTINKTRRNKVLNHAILSEALHLLPWTIGACLAFHIFTSYFFSINLTWGISMLPTLNSSGDWVLISKFYRRGRQVQIGDLVSYVHPAQRHTNAIKRVVGLEGDFVIMGPGYVDDHGRDREIGSEGKMIQIPPGHCWLVGDNLKHSRDSRLHGPLPLALIRGKIIARWSSTAPLSWQRIENSLRQPPVEEDVD